MKKSFGIEESFQEKTFRRTTIKKEKEQGQL